MEKELTHTRIYKHSLRKLRGIAERNRRSLPMQLDYLIEQAEIAEASEEAVKEPARHIAGAATYPVRPQEPQA